MQSPCGQHLVNIGAQRSAIDRAQQTAYRYEDGNGNTDIIDRDIGVVIPIADIAQYRSQALILILILGLQLTLELRLVIIISLIVIVATGLAVATITHKLFLLSFVITILY